MFYLKSIYLFYLLIISIAVSVAQNNKEMAYIKGGAFVPLYGNTDKSKVKISDFLIDKYPVTNEQFLNFVKTHPEYSKTNMKGIFAEKNYLDYWIHDTSYGGFNAKSPVTNVSWFAAKNYCECMGKRLPQMDEWEYVAMADEKTPDSRQKEEFNKYILSWYEKPKSYLNIVGSTFKNYWGVYDMHGLIWEWTNDFNSIFLSGESRKDKDTDKLLFCGSGSVNASDLMDYAAFMRYAFRGSLKANYTTRNLGFRCAKDTVLMKSASNTLKSQ